MHPLAGIDPVALSDDVKSQGLLGMFNVFSGGAVQMAIFALGIMPYISASIIVQLLTGVSDYFKNLKDQGEIGEKIIKSQDMERSLSHVYKAMVFQLV